MSLARHLGKKESRRSIFVWQKLCYDLSARPTKVERVALQNAASVAALLLTTEALICDLPEEKPAAAPAMPHGDMY